MLWAKLDLRQHLSDICTHRLVLQGASKDDDVACAGVEAPNTPPKTNKKVAKENKAKAGNTVPKKRQSHIDEMLHKTRRGAVAKTGKATQKIIPTAGTHLPRSYMPCNAHE